MTQPDSYLTIKSPSEGLYKEKGSKFLSFAFPVSSLEEVKVHLEDLKKEYHDARHYCYAYIIGPDKSQYRANDDGEPGHSAGDPILGQIRSKDLTNVLVVVVRYFGGTKLGVSGLINAYKTAAAEALDVSKVKKIDIAEYVRISYPYELTNEIMRIITDLKIVSQEFSDNCNVEVAVKKAEFGGFLSKLKSLKQQDNRLDFSSRKG